MTTVFKKNGFKKRIFRVLFIGFLLGGICLFPLSGYASCIGFG